MLASKKIKNTYAIIPDKAINITQIEKVLMSYNVCCMQYRRKNITSNVKIKEAKQIQKLCKKYNTLFIINDDLKLCQEINADGVHLGAYDISLKIARKILIKNKVIGISCYDDINLAIQAEKDGADYVAFGSVFTSKTKLKVKKCPLSVISNAKKILSIPIVAIGGINESNKNLVITAGADAYAMIDNLC